MTNIVCMIQVGIILLLTLLCSLARSCLAGALCFALALRRARGILSWFTFWLYRLPFWKSIYGCRALNEENGVGQATCDLRNLDPFQRVHLAMQMSMR